MHLKAPATGSRPLYCTWSRLTMARKRSHHRAIQFLTLQTFDLAWLCAIMFVFSTVPPGRSFKGAAAGMQTARPTSS
jgi:hypothetical protein